jgi:hypothetical protein
VAPLITQSPTNQSGASLGGNLDELAESRANTHAVIKVITAVHLPMDFRRHVSALGSALLAGSRDGRLYGAHRALICHLDVLRRGLRLGGAAGERSELISIESPERP